MVYDYSFILDLINVTIPNKVSKPLGIFIDLLCPSVYNCKCQVNHNHLNIKSRLSSSEVWGSMVRVVKQYRAPGLRYLSLFDAIYHCDALCYSTLLRE